jgi:Rad3-related DNA helicase
MTTIPTTTTTPTPTPTTTTFVPCDIGLPIHFTDWRANQLDAANFMVDTRERFVGLCAPTGFGKSLAYMAAAYLSGKRTVVLTSTKGLQDQIARDFESISTDIRGMMNYPCTMAEKFGLSKHTRVADAPCHSGAGCNLRGSGCGYFDDYRRAQVADIVVTNYQCWFYDQMKGKSNLKTYRPVDMLICDEAHDAIEELSSYLSTVLERKDCLSLDVGWPQSGYHQQEWQDWASLHAQRLELRIETLKEQLSSNGTSMTLLHEIKVNKELLRKLERVSDMRDEWCIEELDRHGDTFKSVKFDPLWPRKYAEANLFRGVPKVVLVSATVREKTAELLGIGQSDLAFQEFPSSFPVERRPVIHVPTVRMNFRNEQDDDQMMWFLRKLDLLVGKRGDRKGVIHAVSYKRARFILDNSEHKGRMMVHGTDTRASTIDRFLRASPESGAVLVSPSVDTGYDFRYTAAEYQIIVKIPFVDTRGTVMKARCREDKDYGAYLAAQTLQQMTGRVMRAEDDMGETLVLDDNCVWFVPRYKRFLNGWWIESFRTVKGKLPEPLEKLRVQVRST